MLGRRRAAQQAPNATVVPAAVYTPDPAGWGLFNRLTTANARYLTGQPAVVTPGSATGGWVATPQQFRGLNLGAKKPISQATSTLDQERSDPISTPGQDMFWARLQRGKA